jgi:hypothetical protein
MAVDREGLGTLGLKLNDFKGSALIGRSSRGVNFGRTGLTHGKIRPKNRPFQTLRHPQRRHCSPAAPAASTSSRPPRRASDLPYWQIDQAPRDQPPWQAIWAQAGARLACSTLPVCPHHDLARRRRHPIHGRLQSQAGPSHLLEVAHGCASGTSAAARDEALRTVESRKG